MKWISADYIKELMKNDRLMQGNAEYKLWEQEVDRRVDAMPSIDVMDVVTAYQQGWCDALDASIVALNDAKFQLAKADRKTEPQYDAEEVAKDINHRVDMVKKEWNARHIEDEPQTGVSYSDHTDYDEPKTYVTWTEPQTETEIAKAIVHKMIDDAVIAEDAYPDLRQKMHDAVDEYEPQTERSE